MRGFIILCLTSLVAAAPQGYNYAVQNGGAGSLGTTAFLKDLHAVTALHSSNLEPPTASGFGSTYPSAAAADQYAAQPQTRYLPPGYGNDASVHQQPIVSKRFFIHSAPEEPEEAVEQRHITIGQPRKNYNVVFIRAPAKAAQKTKLKISQAVNEDKTLIYVLAKKADESQIETLVQEHPAPTARPEVFFIKYKTNEEAEHAQRNIQAQYDSLGGSTQVTNEGVAPVSSVIGSLDAQRNAGGPYEYAATSNAYLPPGKYRQ